jgi:putative nucleotidyltransferase with HDIG domain
MFPVEHRSATAFEKILTDALPGALIYAVGGSVRDAIMAELGRPTRRQPNLDYLVAGMAQAEILRRLASLGRAELVGASFGVIKLTVDGTTLDIALPRRERSTGLHHRAFEIEAGPDVPLEEDLARRDFRMNMLARDVRSGAIVDPYGGRADIEQRRLDVLDERVFKEDPLRILRGAQFAARFELTATSKTLAGMRAAAELLPSVAAERMADELTKLLVLASRPSIGLEVLRETGALQFVLPELLEGWGVEQNEYHAYTVYEHSLISADQAPPELTLRLAALFHDVGKPRTKDGPHFYKHEIVGEEMTRERLSKLRFSGDTVDRVAQLVRHHMYSSIDTQTDASVRRFIKRVGPGSVEDLFALRRADVAATGLPPRDVEQNQRFEQRVHDAMSAPHVFSVADIAIDGRAVIAIMQEMGLAGEAFAGDGRVGAALRHCLEEVLENPSRNEAETLRTIVREFFSNYGAQKS